jgi:hypothetical protein
LLGAVLRKALHNYMLAIGLDDDVRAWFSPAQGRRGSGRSGRKATATVPATTVPSDFTDRALSGTGRNRSVD